MRKIVPPGGGSSTTGRQAASACPTLSAGDPSVTHRLVSAKSSTPGNARTWGEGSSLMIIDLPSSLWPVTTRRIFFGMRSSPALTDRDVYPHEPVIGPSDRL